MANFVNLIIMNLTGSIHTLFFLNWAYIRHNPIDRAYLVSFAESVNLSQIACLLLAKEQIQVVQVRFKLFKRDLGPTAGHH